MSINFPEQVVCFKTARDTTKLIILFLIFICYVLWEEKLLKPKISEQGRRQRRVRWSRLRTRRKKKGSEEDEDEDAESSSEEEVTEEDDSDEDYQVEKKKRRRNRNKERNSSDTSTSSSDDLPPNDDPCKHCGLPNHPELVS